MLRNNLVSRLWRSFASGRNLGLVALSLAASISAQNCHAAIVPIAPPASVVPGALEDNDDTFLFIESEQTLQAPLAVDISVPGNYTFGVPLTPGVIPAGTPVRSYMLHRDTVNNAFKVGVGIAISPTKILGIIATDASLDATDALLGNAGTAYPTGLAYRSPELTFPILPDTIIWSKNSITIAGVMPTAAVIDQFRVIALIPEPATLTMLSVAAAVVGIFGWRRRRTA